MFIQFLQFYRFACQKLRLGLNCKEEGTKLKEPKRWRPNERTNKARRTNEEISEKCRVTRHSRVLHGISRKRRKTHEQCRSTRHFKENPTLHDILRTDEQKREHFRVARHLSRATRLLGEISINMRLQPGF